MTMGKSNKPSQTALLSCYCYQGALEYPKELERINLSRLSLSRPQVVAQVIRERYISQPGRQRRVDTSKILFFKVEKTSLPRRGTGTIHEWKTTPYLTWVYSQNGDFLGQRSDRRRKFRGRDPKKLRFWKGDLVQFITEFSPLELQLGIVLSVPFPPARAAEVNRELAPMHLDETDDTYGVYLWDGDDFAHDHLPECYLFEPTGMIDQRVRERLLALLEKSQ